MITQIIAMIALVITLAYIQMLYDKGLAKQFDLDHIRTKEENKLLHKLQLPNLTFTLAIISFLTWPKKDDIFFLVPVPWALIVVFLYWIVFDILVNKLWLKKSWFYIGSTAETDEFFKTKTRLYLITKFGGLAVSIGLYILLLNI